MQPSTVALQNFRSWFNDTRYARRKELEDMMKDPIFTLLGEDTTDNRSDTLSTMGVDYSGIAKAKVPGGQVVKDAPVEMDTHSVQYITFVKRFNYELESILHDQYKLLDPNGTECVKQLWEAVGLFLTNCIWNENDGTSFNVLAHEGVISYSNGTPDDQPIVSASHSGPGYTGATNIGGTGVLSGPNLVTNIQVGKQNCRTASGYPRSYRPNQIWMGDVEPMIEIGRQITGSTKVSSSVNNAVNIYADGSKEIVVFKYAPRVSTTGAYSTSAADLYKWATADSSLVKKNFRYKWIAKPQLIGEKNLDDSNLDSFATAFCRIAFIAENPFCMFQNDATQAPTSAW